MKERSSLTVKKEDKEAFAELPDTLPGKWATLKTVMIQKDPNYLFFPKDTSLIISCIWIKKIDSASITVILWSRIFE